MTTPTNSMDPRDAEIARLKLRIAAADALVSRLHAALDNASSVVDKSDDEDYAYQAELESARSYLDVMRASAGAEGTATTPQELHVLLHGVSDQVVLDVLELRGIPHVALLPQDLIEAERAKTPEQAAELHAAVVRDGLSGHLTGSLWNEVDRVIDKLQRRQADQPRQT